MLYIVHVLGMCTRISSHSSHSFFIVDCFLLCFLVHCFAVNAATCLCSEGISTKLGGMLVFLNEGEGEEHISDPVADQLSSLCAAMQAGDVNAVNSHLLYISTHHWEEAAYWFPALKRLTKL